MLRRLIGEDIEFVNEWARDLWMVRADRGQIEQIVMNLAVNARDAMPAGGRLTFTTTNVELDESDAARRDSATPGPHVMLAVRDTGCGMDAAVAEQVFEPFFTTKDEGKGTGLGLSTVYGIVRQHGGHVAVRSAPGDGATFRIYLPRATNGPGETATRRDVRQEPGRGRNETVLVAEDDAAVRKLAVRVLERKGYRVLQAPDGVDALAVAEAHEGPIHLLLSDVVMPRLGGPKLSRRLSALRPAMKTLFMSGYAANAIGLRGMLEAGTHLLKKPFAVEALARRVRELLDG